MDGAKPRACEALRVARVLGVPGETPGYRSRARARELRSTQGKSLPPRSIFKRVGRFWSVRVGRVVLDALAVDAQDDSCGSGSVPTSDYDRLVG